MIEPLPPALATTLAMVADALTLTISPWWVIASAAVALHGGRPIAVGDVDILIAVEDASRLCDALGLALRSGAADARFRSTLFAVWTTPPLAVEIMAGFAVHDGGGWTAVTPVTRETVMVDGRTLFVPARDELAAIIRRCGRPKDMARAALLDR